MSDGNMADDKTELRNARTIFKYEMPADAHGVCVVTMPQGAHVITFAAQAGVPTLWALVNPGAPVEARCFWLVTTGGHMDFEPHLARFLGTALMHGGAYVLHCFEKVET